MEYVAVAKEAQHILVNVNPCSAAVCNAWSVQLKSIYAPVVVSIQLLTQGSPADEMLVVPGHQAIPGLVLRQYEHR